MPAISHFALLSFKRESSENLSKAFIISITESSSFTENVVSSAQAEYGNILLKILMPLIFLFSLM